MGRIQQVEDGWLGEPIGWREVVGDVAERGPGQQVEAVGEGLRQHRSEVAVAGGELLVERVVERQVGSVVVAHGASPAGVGRVRVR